jgi:hypothetical protein
LQIHLNLQMLDIGIFPRAQSGDHFVPRTSLSYARLHLSKARRNVRAD